MIVDENDLKEIVGAGSSLLRTRMQKRSDEGKVVQESGGE